MADLEFVLGALLSIPASVATYFITRHQSQLDHRRRLRRDFATRLISYRFDLKGEEFTSALNGAALVFADSPRVAEAIRAFHVEITDERRPDVSEAKLLELFRSVMNEVDIPASDFTDQFLLRPFNTKP